MPKKSKKKSIAQIEIHRIDKMISHLWHHSHKHRVAMASVIFLIFFAVIWALMFKLDFSKPNEEITYGVTFSKQHAEFLQLNWQDNLIAALDDLEIRHFRIPAYWSEIEPVDDQFDFSALDWQIEQIGKRGGTVILAVGQRTPRWPECHIPSWAENLDTGAQQQKILQMLPVVISRYEDNPTIIRWQVENEPLLGLFGECPRPDEDFLQKEIALVRRMDSTKPIMSTASGELGDWDGTGEHVDILGVSLYRTIWKPLLGYFDYPLPAAFYTLRAKATMRTVPKIVLSEMQAEPWLPGAPPDIPFDEQYRSMNSEVFEDTLAYSRAAGFDEIYLWGLEWWYWLKTSHNKPAMWETARTLWGKN